MNNSTKYGIMLVGGTLLASLPLMAGVFKKQISGDRIEVKNVVKASLSPVKHQAPERTDAATEGLRLRGLVVNADTPYIGEITIGENGVLKVANIYEDDYLEASGSAVYADGKFIVNDMYEASVGDSRTYQTIYDANTWDIIEERPTLYNSSSGICMTYDPFDCAVYGYFYNDDNDMSWFGFGRMNLATGDTYQYNSVDQNDGFMCIAASPDGYIYGVDIAGQYCRIDKKTGVVTVIGHTDVKPSFIQSATFDWNTGTLYWAAMTDTGESILYSIDPETYMAKKIGNLPKNQEFVGLYVAEDPILEKTPAKVSELSVELNGANLEGTVSFVAPTETASGAKLSGSLTAYAAVDGKNFSVSATPGQTCQIPVTASNGGLYIISAWVATDQTQGEKSTIQKWFGADRPVAVTNVVCRENYGMTVLTWDEVSSVGQHGGYVDPARTSYVIGREGGPGRMTPIHDYTSTIFEQSFPEEFTGKVKYYVRPVFEELAGPITYSNEIMIGDAVNVVPCTLSLTKTEECIIIDANKDDDTWKGTYFGYTSCPSPADDWILTPLVKLEAGQIYSIEFEASANMGVLSPQTLEVKAGIGDTDEDMTIPITEVTVSSLRLSQPESFTGQFSVTETGNYRLGFHNKTEGGGETGLFSVKITAAGASAGPAASTACSVTAAPEGELKSTVNFTAPTKNSEGETLQAISRIEVTRGNTVVGSVENPEPGKAYSVTDENAVQGENTYQICAYGSKDEEGLKATVKGWVGIDVPGVPENVNMIAEGNILTISWNLPEIGTHGGYVKKEDVVYTIIEPTYYIELTSVQGTESVKIDLGELTGQSIIQLAVLSSNQVGANNEGALTPVIVVGPAYTLPFFETFPNGKVNYSWSQVGGDDDDSVGWAPVGDKGPDGEAGVSTYFGYLPYDAQALRSRKVSLKDSRDPKLRLFLFSMVEEDTKGTFTVEVSEEFNGTYTPIYTKTCTEVEGVWSPLEIDLSAYNGKEIFFQFKVTPEYGTIVVGIDDISIRSAIDYDASLEAITVDKADVEVGATTATVRARVQNHGIKDLMDGNYMVNFFAGDRMFASLPGKKLDASFGQNVFTAEFKPEMDDNDPTNIWAKIISDVDEIEANNTSKVVSINVDKVECPSVDDLQGSENAGAVELSWSEPDLSGLPVRTITDDFSSYRTFSINKAGEWTIIDGDGGEGTKTSYFFPGSTGAIGWMVLNPESIPTLEGTLADRLPAYSGTSYMVAYNPFDVDNDDWLITPELSGNAQEISFMARAESSRAGREMFEVYYSKTGNTIEDMIRLDDIDWRTSLSGWEEFKFQLPEGARYFAVRCVSHSRLAMHIDEFKYESAPTPLKAKLLGYNIYRNDVRINDELVTATSYTDVPEADTRVVYTVRAVYDRGEAPKSNEVTISTSGVTEIYMHVDPTKQAVYDVSGRRVMVLNDGEIYVTNNRRFIYKTK